jgi:DNA excision repair protein ERCC-2
MRIDTAQWRIELSAQDFAGFRPGPAAGRSAPAWRAEAGRQWHETLRQEAEAREEGWRFEVPLKAELRALGWTLAVTGRADQWREREGDIEVIEVKTVLGGLPRAPRLLRESHPHHFLQLGAYCHAARLLPGTRSVRGTLVLVDPTEGTRQEVALDDGDEAALQAQAEVLAAHAENRRAGNARLLALPDRAPFADPRPEWSQAGVDLDATAGQGIRLLVAPTGFGKTSAALRHGLSLLRSGRATKLVYVTGKGTGQLQVMTELRRLAGPAELRAHLLRPRAEHELEGMPDDPADIRRNWARAGIDAARLLESGADLGMVRQLGRLARVPPWLISKAMAAEADVLICDYNYVFAPAQRPALELLPGWDASDHALVVDEAHNLPERVAECLSLGISAQAAVDAAHALGLARAPREWVDALHGWAGFLGRLPAADSVDPDDRAEAVAHAERFSVLAVAHPLDLDSLPEPAARVASSAPHWQSRLDALDSGWLLWSPEAGMLRLDCLSAARTIGERLREQGRALLLSGTPGPRGALDADCGLEAGELPRVVAHAPWRHGAYRVAIDARVDTRFRSRDRHLPATAATLARLAGREGPVAAFFPSYRYAEAAAAALRELEPGVPVAMQPRGLRPDGMSRFLDQSLRPRAVLCLIVGGALGEGIDLLGGRIGSAVVIGPALPEVNALQEARRRMFEQAGAEDPFALAYIRPGMRKVNQALGRLVRAPGQSARVLLHCRRFAEEAYRAALSPEYGDPEVIATDEDLGSWLG